MAGSLLGPDQVRKINAAFPALVDHLRALLVADHTGVGLMRVHCMVETFDSDEMSKLFRELSFISPREKLALVRAAIYELLVKEPALFIAPEVAKTPTVFNQPPVLLDQPKTFAPPQLKLNVNVSDAAEVAKTDTKPTPIVTSTHTSIAAKQLEAGKKEQSEEAVKLAEASKEALAHDAAQQAKLDAAAAKLRELSKPMPIVIPEISADVDLQASVPEE